MGFPYLQEGLLNAGYIFIVRAGPHSWPGLGEGMFWLASLFCDLSRQVPAGVVSRSWRSSRA